MSKHTGPAYPAIHARREHRAFMLRLAIVGAVSTLVLLCAAVRLLP